MTRLITITHYKNITDELRPFVEFQAVQKQVTLEPGTRIALLQVEDIPSYHTIFLDSGITIDEIISELGKQELMVSEDVKNTLSQNLKSN